MNKLKLIIFSIVALITCFLFFGMIALAYYDENPERAPCNYWKFAEHFGYGSNESVSWDKRIECGLIHQEIKEDYESLFNQDITFNTSKLKDLKYKIEIDCAWVNDHVDNDTVTFDEEIAVLCQRYFPNATGLDALVEVDE